VALQWSVVVVRPFSKSYPPRRAPSQKEGQCQLSYSKTSFVRKSDGNAGVELAKVLYDVSPKIAARKQAYDQHAGVGQQRWLDQHHR